MTISDTVVELEGVNGEWFNLTTGDRGIYLATGVTGLYDPPVKVVYEEPGNFPGARYLNHRILRRDIVFGVEILHGKGADSWLSRDSEWRKAWAFDRDCILHITTPESGTRSLKIRLGESPDISLQTDPRANSCNKAVMTCISGDPFWYGEDAIYTAVTQEDTSFDPNALHLPWPWPQTTLPKETLHITVDPDDGQGGLNPTDQAVFLKWIAPGSAYPPSEPYVPGLPWLGAPKSRAVIWTIPDYDFFPPDPDQPDLSNRRLRMPGLIGGLRTEEIQAIFIDGRPTGGTFTIGYGEENTLPIAYNANSATVHDALIALAGITAGDVLVNQKASTNEQQTVRLNGGATSGTFTLTLDGETTDGIPWNSSEAQMQSALAGLDSVGYADVSVSSVLKKEVQRIELIGEPTGGYFTLTLDGQTTGHLAHNATTVDVYNALKALPNITDGLLDLSVTGENLFIFGPYDVIFTGPMSGVNINELTGDASGLEGGAGLAVQVTTKTDGDHLYTVHFKNNLAGFNLPLMTADASGLIGGVDPSVDVEPLVDGSRPYVVTFTDDLSGVDVPEMTIDTDSLTGGSDVTGYVTTVTPGFTASGENILIDTDPRVEQVVSQSGSQIWSRMNGVRFRNPVPPYTRDKDFEITVSGAPPGQLITLRVPRPWTRPWGLE